MSNYLPADEWRVDFDNPQDSTSTRVRTTADRWHRAYLTTLAQTGNKSLACRAAGIDRSTPYKAAERLPDFAAKERAAWEMSSDVLRAEAWRRAVQGVEEPVVSAGKIVTTVMADEEGELVRDEYGKPVRVPLMVRRYSDALLKFLLEGAQPEEFARRVVINERVLEQEKERLQREVEVLENGSLRLVPGTGTQG